MNDREAISSNVWLLQRWTGSDYGLQLLVIVTVIFIWFFTIGQIIINIS